MATLADGYGWNHRRARITALEMLVEGTPCPLCRRPMYRRQALDLHHLIPSAYGGKDGPRALAHARCNRQDGQRISARRAAARGRRGQQRAAIRRSLAAKTGRVTNSDRRQW